MDTRITFGTSGLYLEGRLNHNGFSQAALITHPHPLYGGDMDNSVVSLVADTYAREGWSTLRFNFRGAGNSEGQFDDGIGEQEDVRTAIQYLRHEGYERIDLAGYSFGAWVLAEWARKQHAHPHRLIFLAPPVAFIHFGQRSAIPGLAHVFVGSLDDLAPSEQIASALPQWHPDARLCVIPGGDHSFWGHFQSLQHAMAEAIR